MYREDQTNQLYRRRMDIWAFRVLEVTPEGIVIQLPKPFGENKTTELPLSASAKAACKVGLYVDVSMGYTVSGGEAHSYQAKYWGPTPDQFVPTNGENISKA